MDSPLKVALGSCCILHPPERRTAKKISPTRYENSWCVSRTAGQKKRPAADLLVLQAYLELEIWSEILYCNYWKSKVQTFHMLNPVKPEPWNNCQKIHVYCIHQKETKHQPPFMSCHFYCFYCILYFCAIYWCTGRNKSRVTGWKTVR